ncbi:hypothetical protein Taro_044431 [Colocasia esculenta]|uniref:Uncharacterized protein n=1 Tax=Colocasia esculenta TaxID=4460 RepID=A0A843WJ51_COLES|nr:hypothetical protein [Colocasia esculenta]
MSPSQDPGLKPGRPSPSPSLAPLLSPSLSLALSELPAVLGCLPRVEAAVLRRVLLRPCKGRVRAVRCEEETFQPTRRPQRPVLLLTASLLTAPEPFGEVRRGTVVRPDYGGYCCVACVLPRSDEMRGPGPRSRIRRRWTRLTAESPPSVFTSRVVVTTSSRTEFPTESTFRTELALASLPHFLFVGESSQQRQSARRAEETGR